jgi:hypothetical protein
MSNYHHGTIKISLPYAVNSACTSDLIEIEITYRMGKISTFAIFAFVLQICLLK